MSRPIEIGLFAFVDEAATGIQEEDELSTELDAESGLLLFVRDFYVQFFENVLEEPITSIGTRSALKANRLMRAGGKRWDTPVRALVRRFQKLCKLYPELLGEQYESADVIASFQRDFVIGMLAEIVTWARSVDHAQIAERAAESESLLRSVVEEVPLT